MEDYVFIKIVETEVNNNHNKTNKISNKCDLKTIYFYKVGITDHNDILITKDMPT